MERYLRALRRSLLALGAALVVTAVGIFDAGAQTTVPPTVYAILDDGTIAAQLAPLCTTFSQIDPTIATCTLTAPSLTTNVSGDSSTCFRTPGAGKLLDFKFNDAALAQAFAALAGYFDVSNLTLITEFGFATFPVTNSCSSPIYVAVHLNGVWIVLDSVSAAGLGGPGAIAPGATPDIFVEMISISNPAATLPDAVLACSATPVVQNGNATCPSGTPLAPSGCTLTATPAQLPAAGGAVTLTTACSGGGAPTSFAWTGPGVNPSTTTPSQQVNVTARATFTVTAGNASGAAPSASVTVTVAPPSGPPPTNPPVCTLTATPPQLPAGGGTVTLTASCNPAATSFTWSGPLVNPTGGASQQVTLNANATFSVVGMNAGGSSAPASVTVNIAGGKTYVFTTIDYPGVANDAVLGINNVGQLVIITQGNNFFVYQSGVYVPLPAPSQPPPNNAQAVDVMAINDLGVMVGQAAFTSSGNIVTNSLGVIAVQDQLFATAGGFVLGGASYTYFGHPGYNYTEARAIGNSGLITGLTEMPISPTSPFSVGFIYDPVSTQFTDIVIPGSGSTLVQGINASGQVVGSNLVLGKPTVAFMRDSAGTITQFTVNGSDTNARGINDSGIIAGFIMPNQAFVGNGTLGYELLSVPGAKGSWLTGINNASQVVGGFADSAANSHGLLGTPIALNTGTTPSGAYQYAEPVTLNAPIFVAPTVASGFAFATGSSDPLFAGVRLPPGSNQSQFTLTVSDQTFTVYAGDLFDFRTRGFPNGVAAFSVTGIDTSVFTGAANARAFPIELDFVGAGTFTGTQTPLGP